jgi:UDP-N-acetylmuramate--alanine ligase
VTRSAAEIGQGLAAAREARPIWPGERIHVIGAAGAGASGALLLAYRAGGAVTGCDPGGPSPYTAAAEALGLGLAWEHSPAHVVDAAGARVDRAGVTKALTAVSPDHPELQAAREAGISLEPWQQVVADAAATRGSRLVAIAGTHGKSTSAGWLVHVLAEAGRDPSGFVGALMRDEAGLPPATARWGSGTDFVVEADEYAGNFDPYRPAVALLLNAEWDHPDVFPDEGAVLDAFEAWVRRMEPWAGGGGEPPVLVANIGSPGVCRVLRRLGDWRGRLVVYRLFHPSELPRMPMLEWEKERRFEYRALGGSTEALWGYVIQPWERSLQTIEHTFPHNLPGQAHLRLSGFHSAANALGVMTTSWVLGLDPDDAGKHAGGFTGVGRRMELKGEVDGVAVLDDYGHHPTAIAATIEAARERYPGRRLWAVYEPLTYHRTAAMLDAFADVLATADEAVVADIWAGRDPDTSIVSAADLAQAVNARSPGRAGAPGSVETTADHLAERVKPGDVVLVMGGGRSYVIAERLVGLLQGRQGKGLG